MYVFPESPLKSMKINKLQNWILFQTSYKYCLKWFVAIAKEATYIIIWKLNQFLGVPRSEHKTDDFFIKSNNKRAA